jgi:hypothetical protein
MLLERERESRRVLTEKGRVRREFILLLKRHSINRWTSAFKTFAANEAGEGIMYTGARGFE